MPMTTSCNQCGAKLIADEGVSEITCFSCGTPVAVLQSGTGVRRPYAEVDVSNPYRTPLATSPVQKSYDDYELAGRFTRWLGAFVDNLIFFPCVIVGVLIAGAIDNEDVILVIIVLAALPVLALQAYLISTSGQSIGKKLLGTKIVNYSDNENPGFVRAVLLRSWVMGVIGMVPMVGGLFGLVDALFIFGDERRCVHDLMAGTRVISIRR